MASGPVKGQPALRHDFDGARYLFSGTQAPETIARAKENWATRK